MKEVEGQPEYGPSLLHGWHLRKEVNLAHIGSTVALIIVLLNWGYKMDLRLALAEQQIEAQVGVDDAQNRVIAESVGRLERLAEKIEKNVADLTKFLVEKRTFP